MFFHVRIFLSNWLRAKLSEIAVTMCSCACFVNTLCTAIRQFTDQIHVDDSDVKLCLCTCIGLSVVDDISRTLKTTFYAVHF